MHSFSCLHTTFMLGQPSIKTGTLVRWDLTTKRTAS
jgi:hypothetical protein